jgi:Tol biopolymer transport system component/DNA-binding winged helix-turn-helix (wHTH) protein
MAEGLWAEARAVRFGVFELDVRSGELRKAGVRIMIQGQPLQVLIVLLEHPGELVTRDELRARLWPADTFVDFEHGLNAAVKRLRDTLGDAADTPLFIETVPRRGYRFSAPVERLSNDPNLSSLSNPPSSYDGVSPSSAHLRAASTMPAVMAPRRRRTLAIVAVVVAVILVALAGVAWLALRFRPPEQRPQVVPLTALSGNEYCPAISPDGNQIAFSWVGEKRDNIDIYVMLVGSTDVKRLTTNPVPEYCPSWSPDGRRIAYMRQSPPAPGVGTYVIHVMSALGGSDVKLSDVPVWGPLAWSPDGNYIVAALEPVSGRGRTGIYLFPVAGGEPRAITAGTNPVFDRAGSFSPDGRRVAYARCTASWHNTCDVFVVEVDRTFAPAGPPKQLTRHASFDMSSIAWTRDGRYVIYDVLDAGFSYLWRARADGREPPERIEAAGLGAFGPRTAPSVDRLVFVRDRSEDDVYRFDVGGSSRPLLTSSMSDSNAHFSSDGQRVTFCSNRSGLSKEVWIAAADGSGAQQLTHGPGRWQCSPHWSPDGRWIVFDSKGDDGHSHIWRIDADGGLPQQVTTGAGDQNVPTYSHDGEWI